MTDPRGLLERAAAALDTDGWHPAHLRLAAEIRGRLAKMAEPCCPKCGGLVTRYWCSANRYERHLTHGVTATRLQHSGEAFHFNCSKCHYEWIEEIAPAGESQPPTMGGLGSAPVTPGGDGQPTDNYCPTCLQPRRGLCCPCALADEIERMVWAFPVGGERQDAVRALAGRVRGLEADAARLRAVAEAAKPALVVLDEFLEDAGGCDHSVGICMCADIGIADDLRAALAKWEGR